MTNTVTVAITFEAQPEQVTWFLALQRILTRSQDDQVELTPLEIEQRDQVLSVLPNALA